jgi:hypothetical protein
MTLKYLQGFETMADDSDFRAQNWQAAPVKYFVAPVPSFTGIAGTAVQFLSGGSGSASALAPGAASAPDLGYYNTGETVQSAWAAGGFTFGFAGLFNSNTELNFATGNGGVGNSSQACFDGTHYWAIGTNNVTGAYGVYFSTDLMNWSLSPSQPTSVTANSTLSYMGSGVVMVIGTNTASTSLMVYYTSNAGVSWTSQALGTAAASGVANGTGMATGNATYPHVVRLSISTASNIVAGGIYVGTLGGAMTEVLSIEGPVTIPSLAPIRKIGNLIVTMSPGQNNSIYFATASNVSLNSSGAWSTATQTTTTSVITDVNYIASTNIWVLSCAAGIFSFPNTGASGTPTASTGAITLTSRYTLSGSSYLSNVYLSGTTLVALGGLGLTITSTTGETWTQQGQHILPIGNGGTTIVPRSAGWNCTIYDGARYVLFADVFTGLIAVTPDLMTNYQAKYAQNPAQAVLTNFYGCVGIWSGTAPTTSGTWTANNDGFSIKAAAVSSGTRLVTLGHGSATTTALSSSVSAPGQHYYEIVATSAVGTTNTFNVSLYIDGTLVGTDPTVYSMGSSSSDTTSLLILTLDRSMNFVAYDDMYIDLNDGLGGSGPQGRVNIIVRRSETDVQNQWTKTGGTSNSLSVNQMALSSLSTDYVSSATAGNKDIYACSDTIPTGYQIRAVQMEGFFTNTGATPPEVTIGVSSSGTESDSSTTTLVGTTPNYVPFIVQNNPNGNVAWTIATVEAAEFVLTHVA